MPNSPYSNSNWKKPSSPQTAPMKVTKDLRAKFQLPPQPKNVEKIAKLATAREQASMDEITEIISSESGVTQRLISMAYPKREARVGATVQMATSRLGVNRVIVVMVGDLLGKAIVETFETMVGLPLELEESAPMMDPGFLIGSVRFTGGASGVVSVAFSPHFALLIASHLLGGNVGEEYSPEQINDVIGELVNIITGNLQSKLCDAGMPSEVGLPQVTYQYKLPQEAVEGGSIDQFFFRHGTHLIGVCLSIDPTAQKSALRAPSTHGTNWRANGS